MSTPDVPKYTDAELVVRADYKKSIAQPFGPMRDDQSWSDKAWEEAVAAFKSRHNPELIKSYMAKGVGASWEELRGENKKGMPDFLKPGWVSPMIGKQVENLGGILDDPSVVGWVKGGAEGWREAKVLVLEFWATWCPPCVEAFPHLSHLADKYANSGVKIIGVNVTNEVEQPHVKMDKIGAFVRKQGNNMRYAVGVDLVKTVESQVIEPAGFPGLPLAFLLTPSDGVLQWLGVPDEGLESAIIDQLEKQSVATQGSA